MSFSIVQYYGEQNNRCGYCKGTIGSIAHGMHAVRMSPSDYQDLIDRGWRRCGHYCYKPHLPSTCCPSYTIKCDALEFKLSKSHKKVLKRMNRFLREGFREKTVEDGEINTATESDCFNVEPQGPKKPQPVISFTETEEAETEAMVSENVSQYETQTKLKADDQTKSAVQENLPDNRHNSNEALMPRKKKKLRLERRQAKLEAKGIIEASDLQGVKNQEKTLKDYLNEPCSTDKHQLKIKLVRSPLKASEIAYNLYRKYQLTIHNDNPSRLTTSSLEQFLYKSPLQLVKSPDGPSCGYGSFHQQYWLDDKLIAVGVMDILPYCVSSVYFFYDPDYSFLSLGTYGSLREIAMVQQLAETTPALRYYYMGFYIHSIPKMVYKGKLTPSYLLCPETYTWHLLTDEIRSKLDQHKYQRLEPKENVKDHDEFEEVDLENVLLLLDRNTVMRYCQYTQLKGEPDDRDLILEYGKLVGTPCAHRMIYLKLDDD